MYFSHVILCHSQDELWHSNTLSQYHRDSSGLHQDFLTVLESILSKYGVARGGWLISIDVVK